MRKKYANSLSTFGILIFESKISVQNQKTGKNYVQNIIKKSLAKLPLKSLTSHNSFFSRKSKILIKTFSSSPSIYFHQRLCKYPRDSGYATRFVYFWRFRLGLRSGVPEIRTYNKTSWNFHGQISKKPCKYPRHLTKLTWLKVFLGVL